MEIKPIYQTEYQRIQQYCPLPDHRTFMVTVSQHNRGNGWQPATVSYPSSQLNPEEILSLAQALTAAAYLAQHWTANPPAPDAREQKASEHE